ncbi:MAG: chromophore lyase CpcT/CpeT [Calothrix sp. MO_167.B42]|nr:chromophore lyase CpcT/CpeT [Calothrix sp. MO_167.B42]
MKKFPVYTLPFLLGSTFLLTQVSRADVSSPPLSIQVKQVTRWFVGEFDNTKQVANEPEVSLITMSNCRVELAQQNQENRHTPTVYLQQETNGVPFRVRLYSFSKSQTGVKLSIRRFVNEESVLEMCTRPKSQRIIDMANVETQSCDVEVNWQPGRYSGNNEPEGCPTSFPGGKVVSEVTIRGRGTDSLDRIIDSQGNQLSGTEIKFRRIPLY